MDLRFAKADPFGEAAEETKPPFRSGMSENLTGNFKIHRLVADIVFSDFGNLFFRHLPSPPDIHFSIAFSRGVKRR